MKIIRSTLALLAGLSAFNAVALDASSLKLQVYSVMLSTSPLCSNPVTVFSSPTATEVDFLSTPTLGSGNPADGTYQCVIIKMSDLIKFKPSSTSGTCTAGTEYVADVCRADNGGTTHAPDAAGTTTVCTGTDAVPHADPVYLYLTTNASAGSGGQTFVQPTSFTSTSGLHLTAPLTIAGTAKSKFVVNASGKVSGADITCGMNPPVFGFVPVP
jgi:hypothetical protein